MASAGQDQWIANQFPKDYKGFGFDIGANDGMLLSNTYTLEQMGWNILCVEPMQACSAGLRAYRKNYLMCAVAAHAEEWAPFYANLENPSAYSALAPHDLAPETVELRVPVLTLNQIFFMSGFPRLDFVSLDIEGGELEALKGLDIARWRPQIIMAECWPQSTAATELQDYLGPFGYRHVVTLEYDWGFTYAGNHRRNNRQADRHGIEVVARPGAGLPLPADEPRRVRRGRRKRDQADVGSVSTVKP